MRAIERLTTAWDLMNDSWSVIRSEKKMMIFPLLMLLCFAIVLVSFVAPMYLYFLPGKSTYVMLGFFFIVYLVIYFVGTLFHSAMISFSATKFRGDKPNLKSSLIQAMKHWPKLLIWSFISAVVAIIFQAINILARKKGGRGIARLVSKIGGIVWSYATFFVLPLILFEGKGPFASIKGSASLFKDTWGESVAGNIGINIILKLLFLIGALIFGFLYILEVPLEVLIIPGIIYALLVFAFYISMKAVFVTALYRYAKNDDLPNIFSSGTIP